MNFSYEITKEAYERQVREIKQQENNTKKDDTVDDEDTAPLS